MLNYISSSSSPLPGWCSVNAFCGRPKSVPGEVLPFALLPCLWLFVYLAQAPETREIGTREPGAVQSGRAAVAGGQPAGQAAATRQWRTGRHDIFLPSRVRLPAKEVAEEAVAVTETTVSPFNNNNYYYYY